MANLSRFVIIVQLIFILMTCSQVAGQSDCASLQQTFTGCSCSINSGLAPTVDCSFQNRNSVPSTDSGGQIYELKLNNNSITALGSNILQNMNIKKLDLSGNAISSVDNNTFSSIGSSLQILVLSGNSTSAPPSHAFQPLTQLQELVLINYNMLHLEDSNTIFTSLLNLKHLTLDNWNLQSINHGSLIGPNSLESLTVLNQSPMSMLPADELHSPVLQKLQRLRFSYNSINSVTRSVFSGLSQLLELDLSHNSIGSIEEYGLQGLNTLIKLDLSNNHLSNNNILHFSGLTNIEEINLSSNELISANVLSQIQSSKPLKVNLSNNKIDSLTMNDFDKISDKLHTLDLSQNKLMSIDGNTFNGFTNLEVLNLSYSGGTNNFFTLPFSLINSAKTIRHLRLDGRNVNASALWSVIRLLNHLEVISLNSVQLDSIPDMAIANFTNLTSLDVSNNHLNVISQEALVGPRNSLKFVSLKGNSFSTLSACVLYQYSFPVTMTLPQLTCDCNIKWLWEGIKNNDITFIAGQEAMCRDQQILANKKLEDFCTSPVSEVKCAEYYKDPTLTITLKPSSQIKGSFTITWSLSEIRFLKEFKLKVTNLNSHVPEIDVVESTTSYDTQPLVNNTQYEVCVTASFTYIFLRSVIKCTFINNYIGTTARPSEQTGLTQEEIGIIIGCVIGGVVLLAIFAAIVYLVIFRRRPKKEVPMSVPVQPRNFAKSELPAMNEESRTFNKPKKPADIQATHHREGMQVVAISDGQTGHGRVGRAHMLNSDGSFRTSEGSKPSSISDQPSYENEHGLLPPTPSRQSSTPSSNLPPYYNNKGFREDTYDEIPYKFESTL